MTERELFGDDLRQSDISAPYSTAKEVDTVTAVQRMLGWNCLTSSPGFGGGGCLRIVCRHTSERGEIWEKRGAKGGGWREEGRQRERRFFSSIRICIHSLGRDADGVPFSPLGLRDLRAWTSSEDGVHLI